MKAVAVFAVVGVAFGFQEPGKSSAVEDGEQFFQKLSDSFSATDTISASETEAQLNKKFEANLKTTEQLHKQFEDLQASVKNHQPPASLQINLLQQDSSSKFTDKDFTDPTGTVNTSKFADIPGGDVNISKAQFTDDPTGTIPTNVSQFADPNLADAMTKDLPIPSIPGMEKAKNGTSQFVDVPKPLTDFNKGVADVLTKDIPIPGMASSKTGNSSEAAADNRISTFVDVPKPFTDFNKGVADALTKDIPIPGMSSTTSKSNASDATQSLLVAEGVPAVSTFVDPPKPLTDAAKAMADAMTKDIPIPGMPTATKKNATDSTQVLMQARPSAPIFKVPFGQVPKGIPVKMEPAIFFPWMGAQGAAPHWYMGPWFGHNFF